MLSLLAAAVGFSLLVPGAASGDGAKREPLPIVLQAEAAVSRGGGVEEKGGAQGGQCLGAFWGSSESR